MDLGNSLSNFCSYIFSSLRELILHTNILLKIYTYLLLSESKSWEGPRIDDISCYQKRSPGLPVAADLHPGSPHGQMGLLLNKYCSSVIHCHHDSHLKEIRNSGVMLRTFKHLDL